MFEEGKYLNLPFDILIQIIVRLDESDFELDSEVLEQILGLSNGHLSVLKKMNFYRTLKFKNGLNNRNLLNLFDGGHSRRVKKYNLLVNHMILRGPDRFASLTAPYATHKFLLERESENDTREPAFYYPIDVPSVEFWDRVRETERMLKRFEIARLWKKRVLEMETTVLHHHIDDTISFLAFRMEHRFAKVLLIQNLHFDTINKEAIS